MGGGLRRPGWRGWWFGSPGPLPPTDGVP